MDQAILADLAPTGVLRAAINMANFLLVTGIAPNGDPQGVSPDMAHAVADRLGVSLALITYSAPGPLADDAGADKWDIGNIGAEAQRAETIAFTAAYCEIEATYLVPAGSQLQSIADVDKPGNRIAVYGRSAYGLRLQRIVKNAELVLTDSLDSAFETFRDRKLEAYASLRPRLNKDLELLPDARILDGKFSAVEQAIGTPRKNSAGAAFLREFVEDAKASGLVAQLIEKHDVDGLSVAPLA
ncbi:MAG: transporter substrate-binding domain-containing protein [Hyphomicrobiaceae bacterium]